ncbi:MAG: fucose isomerase, partial [Actinobacteria bacterium]|nr:fucose isomerase [Actinomycetota bacterium]
MNKNTKFGVIIGNRGFFNSDLALEGRKKMLNKLNNLGYKIAILPEDETPSGSVETMEDAKKYAKLFKEKSEEIDGIIVSLPNFGDELGIINTIKLSNLNVPILIQASDDYIDKVDLKNRRDAFCGKLSVCNNFYQNKIPFTDTLEHTIDIESEIFSEDIFFFEKVCRVVNKIKKARIGMIGTRPAAFQTMRISEKILQDSGITVIPVDLSEIIFRASNLNDKDDFVQEQKKYLLEYGNIPKEITQNSILKQSKLSVAVNEWVEENSIDALAVQCWTSIQNNYGCAACATMSMLGERLIPSACEADVAGAV